MRFVLKVSLLTFSLYSLPTQHLVDVPYIGVSVVTLAACAYLFQLDGLSQSWGTVVCVSSCFITSLTFAVQENIKQRYAIKFCIKINKSTTQIFGNLTEAYGDALYQELWF